MIPLKNLPQHKTLITLNGGASRSWSDGAARKWSWYHTWIWVQNMHPPIQNCRYGAAPVRGCTLHSINFAMEVEIGTAPTLPLYYLHLNSLHMAITAITYMHNSRGKGLVIKVDILCKKFYGDLVLN